MYKKKPCLFLLILCLSLLTGGNIYGGSQQGSAPNIRLVSHLDLEGGGMVDVKGNLAVIGHMGPPYATTLLDVTDPAKPFILSRIRTRDDTRSHKARTCGTTLVINVEEYGGGPNQSAGLALYDISDPRRPKETAFFPMGGLFTGGTGVHRFQFDCERNLVYASGSADGFQGNFVMIIDVSDPRRPRETGRWWLPGQNIGGGEKPSWSGTSIRTHHPLRMGNRLYVSLWYGGFAILDITDIARPQMVSHVNYHREGGAPTHTVLPVDHRIMGKDWLIVCDEEMGGGNPPAYMRLYDITNEKHPVAVSAFQVHRDSTGRTGARFGAHQPHEYVGPDNLVYTAWFSGGLRVITIEDPYRPREVGRYIPEPGRKQGFAESNDVFVDKRGLIYLIDRVRGLDILQFTGPSR